MFISYIYDNSWVVISNVPIEISEEEISSEIDLNDITVKRMFSAKTGQAIRKVKLLCPDQKSKEDFMKNGIVLGYNRHKVVNYINNSKVIQCFKCQAFGHMSSRCSESQKCKKCGGNHSHKDCIQVINQCVNCKGDHPASFKGCPAYQKAEKSEEKKVMLNTQVAKGPSNIVDTIRMATAIAGILVKVLTKRLATNINESDICKDVAEVISLTHKQNLDGEQIHFMAFSKKPDAPKKQDAPKN